MTSPILPIVALVFYLFTTVESGPQDRAPPPKRPNTYSNKNEDRGWDLGNNRFVQVLEFQDKIFVHIREFYEKDGKMLPGKKGIALSPTQWEKLKELVNDVDKRVSEMTLRF